MAAFDDEADELIQRVDGKNRARGGIGKLAAHKNGIAHRGVHLFLFDSAGRILIQKRSPRKMTAPGLLDMSLAEHVKAGEPYHRAALRGLQEELGVMEVILSKLHGPVRRARRFPAQGIVDREFAVLFAGIFGGKVKLNTDEVSGGVFLFPEDIQHLAKSRRVFTPWFREEWPWIRKLLKQQQRQ